MALTLVQEVRLTIGLVGRAYDLLTDDEITHYLEKNNNNVNKTARSCAMTVSFILAQFTHTKADVLEDYASEWFTNYNKALQMYLKDPSFNFDILNAAPYAGGISISDIRANINNPDNLTLNLDAGIPTDGEATCTTNTNREVFEREPFPRCF